MMWDAGLEHLALLLASIASGLGIRKAIRAWRAESVAAVEQRAEQQRTIESIAAEFKPNHGSSMADRLARIEASVDAHHRKADVWFAANDAAHLAIHTRIDQCLMGQSGRWWSGQRGIDRNTDPEDQRG